VWHLSTILFIERSAIHFKKGLSLPEFLKLYGTEAQCVEALAQIRWLDGFRCPRCEGALNGFMWDRRLKCYQCWQCGYQSMMTAGTIMDATAASSNMVSCVLSDRPDKHKYFVIVT
jgi:Zn ribbon nucleic-acid-binding protein